MDNWGELDPFEQQALMEAGHDPFEAFQAFQAPAPHPEPPHPKPPHPNPALMAQYMMPKGPAPEPPKKKLRKTPTTAMKATLEGILARRVNMEQRVEDATASATIIQEAVILPDPEQKQMFEYASSDARMASAIAAQPHTTGRYTKGLKGVNQILKK